MNISNSLSSNPPPLYTPAQRERRNRSRWTLVQGILAPLQFVVFLISAALLTRYLISGEGLQVAAASVVVKTLFLYAIMYTGALWEHDVFGQYLFAPAFFWEDVISMVVIALHTLYLLLYLTGLGGTGWLIAVAVAAYITYVINAAQFLWKLRQARRQENS
ncbi:MAG: 2-vinyl bacteriochlorophyllide hydratase [Granulosicoccus sp.]|nr:2-vinyl bacteriochlorophyllide hydratase [Granulosicoccus sp.]